jgi:hypothetical protein
VWQPPLVEEKGGLSALPDAFATGDLRFGALDPSWRRSPSSTADKHHSCAHQLAAPRLWATLTVDTTYSMPVDHDWVAAARSGGDGG